ncbi:32321_t:CDS:2 [Gigaspora margarita]|uniref:32321_t:CDS:1 n=1 Tax=Gigaspora margarita TaxID=4874 RepID=A0ABN7VII6_GIGMA|nr:32321_t:CDS:2 [Gigaspora margarita]
MHRFSRYRHIKYIPRRHSVLPAHHSQRRVTLESDIDAVHEVGVLAVKDQKVILQAVHEVEALNVIILKVLGKIMIKTLKMQRVPVFSPVEHKSLNLLHRNDSSRSKSHEYSSSSQCNNLYESHEIGSSSWYNELPSRSCSRSHTSNSLINNNRLELPDSPRLFTSPELSVSPEPTNDKSVIDDNQPNIPTSNNNQSKSHISIRSSFSRDIQSNTSASKKDKQFKISDINPSDDEEDKLTNISLNLYTICILGLTSANNIGRQSSASTREESIQQNTPAVDNHYLSDEGSENNR